MKKNLLMLVAVYGFVACATGPPPGAPTASGPNPAPPGATWVITERNSGSYGTSPKQYTMRSLGEQEWAGQKTRAFTDGDTTVHVVPASGEMIVRTRGTTPVESYSPPVGFNWPIFVGKSWTKTFRFSDGSRSFDNVQLWYKVEAYEDTTVPAGTFKTFRVSNETNSLKSVFWWRPDLGISIKTTSERDTKFYLGPGRRETELVSHDIKR